MIYYLFQFLDQNFIIPGLGVFEYISFRAMLAVIISFIVTVFFGKRIIAFIQKKQISEISRNLGLKGEENKHGTPTMGGVIIIASILIPTLLLAEITNMYIIIMIISTIILGLIGFLDDYIKVFKKDKKGLSAKFKILGQLLLALFVAAVFYFNSDTDIKIKNQDKTEYSYDINNLNYEFTDKKITTIPFVKNNEFDYEWLTEWTGKHKNKFTFILFTIVVVLVIISVSNGANLTDGLDGLATGVCAIIGVTLGVFAYVSSNLILADYLNILYIPNASELVVFIAAYVGSCIAFLWFNSFPAQIFMGDTGSLTLGGIIGVFAILIRKELLLPLLCGVFLIENLSVILQVSYFKYTKKKFGIGKRIFKMTPIHHHFQLKGIHENKIVIRFWIVALILAVLSVVTLKLR
ncbi:MAG: phospho-N-acetylmuramoyl-pentapeptide-transferase [Flavobacteriales bacterium]|nr:phospho-N-acetylmuramoyl-pentapeptide-transferase [Flavobacteriales bacterium]|tara:strand:- start:161 stop:1381 length:1221 start_codon:yes stop_codon:yes gene_type:complete